MITRHIGATQQDIADMDARVAVRDRLSTLNFTGLPELIVLQKAVEVSDVVWHWRCDGEIFCMAGIMSDNSVWMACAENWTKEMQMAFCRKICPLLASRGEFRIIINPELYPNLVRHVERTCEIFLEELRDGWVEIRGVVKPEWALKSRY